MKDIHLKSHLAIHLTKSMESGKLHGFETSQWQKANFTAYCSQPDLSIYPQNPKTPVVLIACARYGNEVQLYFPLKNKTVYALDLVAEEII